MNRKFKKEYLVLLWPVQNNPKLVAEFSGGEQKMVILLQVTRPLLQIYKLFFPDVSTYISYYSSLLRVNLPACTNRFVDSFAFRTF
jgi:hypothetical protein